jgi:release factor glutamine methyltransferase
MSGSSPEAESWTVGRLIAWTTDFLRRNGSESPRLEAEILLAHALGWPRVKLYMNINEEVGASGRTEFRKLVRNRSEGVPVAYLVGHKEFYSLDFEVSPSVLIPRPDTETLVMTFLELAKPVAEPLCVDVGTGSGCIPIACAMHHPTARFVAIDNSETAVQVARRNVARHGLAERIEVRSGNLLEPLNPDESPDFILSNPPYIPSSEIPKLERNVRDYEPHSALDGGSDGLEIVRKLVDQAAMKLKSGGILLIEIGFDQGEPVRSSYAADSNWKSVELRKDLGGIPRVVVLSRA